MAKATHTAKKLGNKCRYEYRGFVIENLAKIYTNKTGWRFYLPEDARNEGSEVCTEPTLRWAKDRIDMDVEDRIEKLGA
tara:strand:+ start:477 stop:713 length:237 start_codon:yes stop_codon:yes gene_type:complete